MSKISRLLKLTLVVVVLVVCGLDAASPVLLRRRLATAATAAARAAEDTYFRTGKTDEAASAAQASTVDSRVALLHFEVLNGGAVSVTVTGTAESYVLGHIGPLRHYYEVEETATAAARAGAPPPTATTTKAG